MNRILAPIRIPLLVVVLVVLVPPAAVGGLFIWAAIGDVPFVNVKFFPDDDDLIGAAPPPPAVQDFGQTPVPLLAPLSSPHSGKEQPPERRGKDLPAGFRVELWAEGLELPAAMAFAPDGTLYVAEQHTGEIRLVREGMVLDTPRIKIAETEDLQGAKPEVAGERGLVGLVLHPEFADNGLIFAYATLGSRPEGGVERNAVFRIRVAGDALTDVTKVQEWLEASPTNSHNGGAMTFGPDGSLYLSIGDGNIQPDADNPAQDSNDPRGKILRLILNTEGDVTDWEVYAVGFRNPFGLAFHPLTKELVAGDNGPIGNDELNIIRKDGNYGWPFILGKGGDPDFRDPAIVWDPSIVPTGMTFYQGGRLPFLTNDLLMCQFAPTWSLHWIRFSLAGQNIGQPLFDRELAHTCVTSVAVGPDGLIYMAAHGVGLIYRIAPEP